MSQVAAFDTAFHSRMPRVARLYALPRHLAEEGIVRYGFHGLSYEYVMEELHRVDPGAADGRVVAHLGNGASMAAVRDGAGVDTTMGFSPTGGLMMGTRSGDLDPGVLLHLLRAKELDAGALE
jgi:acetate kinase